LQALDSAVCYSSLADALLKACKHRMRICRPQGSRARERRAPEMERSGDVVVDCVGGDLDSFPDASTRLRAGVGPIQDVSGAQRRVQRARRRGVPLDSGCRGSGCRNSGGRVVGVGSIQLGACLQRHLSRSVTCARALPFSLRRSQSHSLASPRHRGSSPTNSASTWTHLSKSTTTCTTASTRMLASKAALRPSCPRPAWRASGAYSLSSLLPTPCTLHLAPYNPDQAAQSSLANSGKASPAPS